MNALPVYDVRNAKTKMRTNGDKIYTNSSGLNVPKDGLGCESFTIIPIDILLTYEGNYDIKIFLDNCVYKNVNMQMIDYLDNNLFSSDEY